MTIGQVSAAYRVLLISSWSTSSSPNTPGLRQWQEKEKLSVLLGMLMNEFALAGQKRGTQPLPSGSKYRRIWRMGTWKMSWKWR